MCCDPLLKPCPFCGASVHLWTKKGRYGLFCYAKCDACEASSKTQKISSNFTWDAYHDGDVSDKDDAAVRMVILHWNRRIGGDQ